MADTHSEHTTAAETHNEPQHSIMPGHGQDDGTTTLPFIGKVPFPVYTVVFIALGILTVIEVILAGVIEAESLRVGVLVILAIAKASLVILFYMHLRHDSRFFAMALLLPTFIALLSALYLLGVPSTGY